MKKLVSGLILIAILLSACSTPAETGPQVGVVTDVVSVNSNPGDGVTPTIEITLTPESLSPQPINRDNFTNLARNILYKDTIEELSGLSIADLAIGIVAYSPDGRYVAFGGCTGLWTGHCQNPVFGPSDSFIYILDALTTEPVASLPETKTTITGLSFSRDGKKLVYALSPLKVAVWDITSGTIEKVIWEKDDGSSYGKLAFSPTSEQIAFVFGKSLYVWSYPEGELIQQAPAYRFISDLPQYSTDGNRLAIFTQGDGKVVAVYDTDAWQVLSTITLPGIETRNVAFSDDGTVLASVAGEEFADILIWNVDSGEQIGTLDVEWSFIDAMDFTPDGKLLFTSGFGSDPNHEESFGVWDLDNMKYLGGLLAEESANMLSFSADGLSFFDGQSLWGAPDKNILAARRVLEGYLLALNTGDYRTAAGSFMRDDYILDWYAEKGYDTTDIPVMLEAVCASPDQLCMPLSAISYSGISYFNEYLFMVQFTKSDGSIYTDMDGYRNIWMYVGQDAAGNYKVIGYPL